MRQKDCAQTERNSEQYFGSYGPFIAWELLARGRRMRVAFLDIYTVEGGSSEGKHGGNFLVLMEQNGMEQNGMEQNGRAKRRKFS